jgi:hypothetical protein
MNLYYFYLKDNNNFITQMAQLVGEQVDAWKIANPDFTEIDKDTYDSLTPFAGKWQVTSNGFIQVPDRSDYDNAALVVDLQQKELLNATDWYVIKAVDTGTLIPTNWQTYRQQLRDVSKQSGYPYNVTWPTPPN